MEATAERDRLGRPFWTLVGSSGVSNLADGIFAIALPLVAIGYTRSPALVAGLETVRSLPWLLTSLHVGALVDRLDRRRAMLCANTARAAFVAIPAIGIAADAGALWLLYIAAIGTGIAEVFYDTSAQSILPSVVDRSRLDRANGRLYAVELGSQQFLGPPIGGILVSIGLAVSFVTSAGLWIVAIVALASLRGHFRPSREGPVTSISADVREGLSFLVRRPLLRTLAVIVGVSNLAMSASVPMLVLFAVGDGSRLGLSEPQFGALLTATAAGGLVGGLVAERIQERVGRARSLKIATATFVLQVAVPAITTNVAVIAVVMFLGGITLMLWNITTVSFRQRVTPDRLLGRVNSAYRLVAWGTMPLGAALGGLLGEWFGVRNVFAIMGVVVATMLVPVSRIREQTLVDAEADAAATAAPAGSEGRR